MSGKEIRQTSGKEVASLFPSQMYFCFMSFFFLSKDNTQVPLSHEACWSKRVWIVQGLSSGAWKKKFKFLFHPCISEGYSVAHKLSHVLNQYCLLLEGKYNLHPISRSINTASQGSQSISVFLLHLLLLSLGSFPLWWFVVSVF